MKVLLITLLLSFVAVNGQANDKVKNKRKTLLNIASNYSPTAHTVFKNVGKYKFQKYIHYKTIGYILEYYEVPVHEATHYYNSIVRRKWVEKNEGEFNRGAGYFIYPSIEIGMNYTPVYNSQELNDIIADSIKEKIDNYDLYIGGDRVKNMSSQINGIYGIMDEFVAYSTGTQSTLELYDYHLANTENGFENLAQWRSYLLNVSAGVIDYYEFLLFIHWYLENSKNAHPEEYEKLMGNKNLRVVFTLANNNSTETIQKYYDRVSFICKQTQQYDNYLSFEASDNQLYKELVTYKGGSRTSILSLYEDDILYSKNLYHSLDQSIIQDFMIKGVNHDNYKEYLE